MKDRALILMATYNGSKYIGQQIQSIIDQDYQDWELCISDDGSNDNTVEIINRYAVSDKRILPLLQDNSAHGACLNFYHLMRYAQTHRNEYHYYFLCDQDDFWEKNKISLQIDKAEEYGDCPVLIYSDLRIISENGEMHQRMSEIQDINLRNPADIFFNQIYVWGNTVLFNKALLDYLVIPIDIRNGFSHDHYLTYYAAAFGKVIYINQPLVRYRRYDNNVSELPHQYNLLKALRKVFHEYRKLIDRHASNYSNILYFIKHAPDTNALLEDIRSCYENGGHTALRIISKYNVKVGSNFYNGLARRIILFTKIYKKSKYYDH